MTQKWISLATFVVTMSGQRKKGKGKGKDKEDDGAGAFAEWISARRKGRVFMLHTLLHYAACPSGKLGCIYINSVLLHHPRRAF